MFLSQKLQAENAKDEQRASWRLDVRETFQVKFRKGKWFARKGKGSVCDISGSGLFFITQTPLKKGSKIELALHFPQGFPSFSPIPLKARVTRVTRVSPSKEYGIGCRLAGLNSGAQETIRQFMWWLEFSLPDINQNKN